MINQQTQNPIQREHHERWESKGLIRLGLSLILVYFMIASGSAMAAGDLTKISRNNSPPAFLKLSLDDALALFLKQNLDLLVVKYGIDAAK
ncbi:MAG: hypothetical protein JSU59_05280, partial [Nitrospirota bacterium]